jgi:hypothetical protein
MTLFTCRVCGKIHQAVLDPPVAIDPEEAEKLRAIWLAADEKLERSPDNEHFEKACKKAWYAYMATKASGVEKLPDTITTKKGGDGWYFLCVEHVEQEA